MVLTTSKTGHEAKGMHGVNYFKTGHEAKGMNGVNYFKDGAKS